MNFQEYQTAAMRTAGGKCRSIVNAAIGLCGEAGEFADAVKKHVFHDHPIDRPRLIKEVGDVLWYVALACEMLGVSLEEVAEANVAKLRARYKDGFSPDDSINRRDML